MGGGRHRSGEEPRLRTSIQIALLSRRRAPSRNTQHLRMYTVHSYAWNSHTHRWCETDWNISAKLKLLSNWKLVKTENCAGKPILGLWKYPTFTLRLHRMPWQLRLCHTPSWGGVGSAVPLPDTSGCYYCRSHNFHSSINRRTNSFLMFFSSWIYHSAKNDCHNVGHRFSKNDNVYVQHIEAYALWSKRNEAVYIRL